jgi:hypothetical protein
VMLIKGAVCVSSLLVELGLGSMAGGIKVFVETLDSKDAEGLCRSMIRRGSVMREISKPGKK